MVSGAASALPGTRVVLLRKEQRQRPGRARFYVFLLGQSNMAGDSKASNADKTENPRSEVAVRCQTTPIKQA
ncbi:hypothetical protein [Sorangium sp. So ce406]|uniref:hypothetical protein n=1 Tax=Sorangium sp. So ce406 TaxID=3133311 RepID=UPI003F5B6FA2